MNNEKKMPQPKIEKDLDQKAPQSDKGIGQQHGMEQKDKQSSSVKPGVDDKNNGGKQPQSSKVSQSSVNSDVDNEIELDDDDNQVTQRSNRTSNEPLKGK